MARNDNLTKLNASRTRKERIEAASKAGKASGRKRRAYASFRECFNENIDDEKRQELFNMLYKRARMGNLKAFEILRDTMGEKPVETVQVSSVDPDTLKNVEDFINGVE